ncbi:U3 small nucleolar RNA-associated protein 11 [Coelomomyces lativittatus]|nr:U3 small nucleolar RNA-associated protein 11 [Coelomomyces lativittatus]KAJ1504356.1 U3 small nucleolar RNA-associated protein 11 [Coelomomyces lativittatus]KAJ1508780.1 U3 small nucleolar RNA-associated protein 11 [Coelomomyces lativittatus]
MSSRSIRNAAPRRTHKERSQPKARRHLGLLEKHKDYAIRAKHYHFKQDRLRKLRQKAANRNPDEFYFAMIHSKTKEGVHQVEKDNNVPQEVIQLMKSQDQNYIANQLRINSKKLESLKPIPKSEGHHVFFDEPPTQTKVTKPLKQHTKKEYLGRLKRDQVLRKVESELQLQKALRGKGRKEKVKDRNGMDVYKWKPERKK